MIVVRTQRTGAVSAAALVLLGGAAARGQSFSWSAGSGAWPNAANWSPAGGPPIGPGQSALLGGTGPYTVLISGVNPVIDALSITNPDATLQIASSHSVTVGSLDNQGSIALSPPPGGSGITSIYFSAPSTTITGGGQIVMHTGLSLIRSTVPANEVVNGPQHIIRGTGGVYSRLVNRGEVIADVAGQELIFTDGPKYNEGVIKATSGGILAPDASSIHQTASGQLIADGGILRFHGDTITGGSLTVINGGALEAGQQGTWFDGVAIDMGGTPVSMLGSGQQISLVGIGGINGPINTTFNTILIIDHDLFTANYPVHLGVATGAGGSAVLKLPAPATTLSGTAEIIMSPGVIAGTGGVVTLEPPLKIRGTGSITATNLINRSTITCDTPGGSLGFNDANVTLQNEALIRAINGGTFGSQPGSPCSPIAQTQAGLLLADGGTIDVTWSAVTGGAIDVVNGGQLLVGRTTITDSAVDLGGVLLRVPTGDFLTLIDVGTLRGPLDIESNATTTIDAAQFTNDHVIRINSQQGFGGGRLTFPSNCQLTGSGLVLLNSPGQGAELRTPAAPGGLTIGAAQTVAGHGVLQGRLVLEGTLMPGHAASPAGEIGTIHVAPGSIQCTPGSTVVFQAAAPSEYDRVFKSDPFVCDGKLKFEHMQGFTAPPTGHVFDIVTDATVMGTFDEVDLPTLPGGKQYIVVYLPDRVRICTSCWPDCNKDCFMNVQDFGCFQTKFVQGDPYTDCNADGVLNVFDFGCFQTKFVLGCPN